MRLDQFERLQLLEEKLMDVFLFEADPEKWPGHNIEPANMDQQTRGDRYWSKKNPAATLMLAIKVQAMVHQTQNVGGTPPTDGGGEQGDGQLDTEIASAEKEAARLMRDLQSGTSKKAFDARVHGKP